MDEEEIVRDFLGDRPDASQYREWRRVLQQRLAGLEAERARGGPGASALDGRIRQMRNQIAALEQEEAVTQFVEDSVRATLYMGAVADAGTGVSSTSSSEE